MTDEKQAGEEKHQRHRLALVRVVGIRTLFVAWTASAVSLGLLFGWCLFAEPHKLGEAAFGTVADWVAAFATLVIGAAAAWYAKEAHELRVTEVTAQNELAAEKFARRKSIVVEKATNASFAAKRFLMIRGIPPDERTVELTNLYMTATKRKIEMANLSYEERESFFDPALSAALTMLNFDLTALRERIDDIEMLNNINPSRVSGAASFDEGFNAANDLLLSVNEFLKEAGVPPIPVTGADEPADQEDADQD